VMLGGNVTVSAGGSVTANGYSFSRIASSGGYVLVRGDVVSLRTSLVTAQGGTQTTTTGLTNVGGDGVIAVFYKTSVTGTSAPAAYTQQVANP
jgi:hypothetical protein